MVSQRGRKANLLQSAVVAMVTGVSSKHTLRLNINAADETRLCLYTTRRTYVMPHLLA